jgi:hypothetical protein
VNLPDVEAEARELAGLPEAERREALARHRRAADNPRLNKHQRDAARQRATLLRKRAKQLARVQTGVHASD